MQPFLPDPEAEGILLEAARGLDSLHEVFAAAEERIGALLDNVRTDEVAKAACVEVLETLPPADPRTLALRKSFASRLY